MAIEIIPRKKSEKSGSSQKKIFHLGIALAFLLIFSSLVFYFLSQRFSQKFSEIDNLIKEQRTEEIVSLEKEIDSYYEKIKDFPLIIKARKSALPSLEIIEKTVHPLVYFFEFEVDIPGNIMKASGIAKNITAFDQQLMVLRQEKSIVSVDVPEFSIKEDRTVEFSVDIVFKQ